MPWHSTRSSVRLSKTPPFVRAHLVIEARLRYGRPVADREDSTLPLALTSFVGREAELHRIRALLRKHRLVTVTGAGGVGKTQTALQAAIERSESPDGSVRFVALAAIRDPSLVVATIAAALACKRSQSLAA